MNFHMPAKINIDKLLYILVILIIVLYLIMVLCGSLDFQKDINKAKNLMNKISMSEVYNYLEEHSNYYYKIDDATYCLTKEELKHFLSDKFIKNMQDDVIEATYKNNDFILKYNKECVPT